MDEGLASEPADVNATEANIQVVDDEPADPRQPAHTLEDWGGTGMHSHKGSKWVPPTGARAALIEVEAA